MPGLAEERIRAKAAKWWAAMSETLRGGWFPSQRKAQSGRTTLNTCGTENDSLEEGAELDSSSVAEATDFYSNFSKGTGLRN